MSRSDTSSKQTQLVASLGLSHAITKANARCLCSRQTLGGPRDGRNPLGRSLSGACRAGLT
eukprot:2258381-Pyramimonas_sp.AAC.1